MIITGKDTACIVSLDKIRSNNNAIANLDACNLLADSLYSRILNFEKDEENSNKVIDNGELQISNLKAQVDEKIITNDLCDKQSKRKDRKILFQKILIYSEGVVIIVETGYIAIKSIFTK